MSYSQSLEWHYVLVHLTYALLFEVVHFCQLFFHKTKFNAVEGWTDWLVVTASDPMPGNHPVRRATHREPLMPSKWQKDHLSGGSQAWNAWMRRNSCLSVHRSYRRRWADWLSCVKYMNLQLHHYLNKSLFIVPANSVEYLNTVEPWWPSTDTDMAYISFQVKRVMMRNNPTHPLLCLDYVL